MLKMTFDDFFYQATNARPYPHQVVFATSAQLVDLVGAPTGTGKTATAVLGWLWRRSHGSPEQRQEAGRRLIFCLPMRTLVEQTERVALEWRSRLGIRDQELGIHALMGGAVDSDWDQHPERPAILIGTQDQLLSRALLRGYGMSRYRWPVHFALLHNDSTWVMDEVQLMGVGSSTAAQLQAFRERFGTHGSAKTVWMTATLAEGRLRTVDVQRELTRLPFDAGANPQLLRRLQAKKTLRKTESVVTKKDAASLAREIGARHVAGTLTLVVVNRVARAQELVGHLEKQPALEHVALIHSRFRAGDRRRIQDAALDENFRGVLVATQAIEAGVDLSSRTLFTELAPWSSLVQRFGRLNRAGEHDESHAFWIDIDTEDKDLCLPYEAPALMLAREHLVALQDVGPTALSNILSDAEEPVLPVLRRKDLLELFDTEPDLAGHDIDVSRYVRQTDERDVHVAWRTLGGEAPSPDAPEPRREELCSVPFFELEKLAGEKPIWRFDPLDRQWVKAEKAEKLFPGLTVVVDTSVGGYSAALGFTRNPKDVPATLEQEGPAPDADDADILTQSADYVTLALHADDTAQEMEALCRALADLELDSEELVEVARWHDLGKAHAVFQDMLTSKLPVDDGRRTSGPWAKSDRVHSGRATRRFFRHELASALAWLQAGKSDLGGFLVAAHHGKVRLSLRARPGEMGPGDGRRFAHGIHEGDALPSADLGGEVITSPFVLSLDGMELGGGGQGVSWATRMLRVLENIGPFRLAYLETLIRVADWRASARRASNVGGTRD